MSSQVALVAKGVKAEKWLEGLEAQGGRQCTRSVVVRARGQCQDTKKVATADSILALPVRW
jgi:hypothetical protein